MITIVIGRGARAEMSYVEEELLRHASPYFGKALKTTFLQEGASGKFELDDKDLEIFGLVNEFIHLGTIDKQTGLWRSQKLSHLVVNHRLRRMSLPNWNRMHHLLTTTW